MYTKIFYIFQTKMAAENRMEKTTICFPQNINLGQNKDLLEACQTLNFMHSLSIKFADI